MKNKPTILLIIFVIVSFLGNSQSIDSLMLQLGRASDTEKPEILIQIADYYKDSQPDRALTYTEDAIEHAQKKGDLGLLSEGMIQKMTILAASGKIHQAVDTYSEVFTRLYEVEDDELLSIALAGIAELFESFENYGQSVYFYEKALYHDTLAKSNNISLNLKLVAALNKNRQYDLAQNYLQKIDKTKIEEGSDLFFKLDLLIADTYCELKRFDHVFSTLEHLSVVADKQNKKHWKAIVLTKFGANFSKIYNYSAARDNYSKAEQIFSDLKRYGEQAACNDSIAAILIVEGKYQESIELLKSNIEIQKNIADSKGIGTSFYYLAKANLKQNNSKDYEDNLIACLNSNADLNIRKDAATLLSEFYSDKSDNVNANLYQNKAHNINSQIIEKTYKDKLLSTDMALLLQQEVLHLGTIESSRSGLGILFWLILFFLIISIAFVFYAFKSRTKIQLKTNNLLGAKNKQIVELEEQIEKYEKQNESLVVQQTEDLQAELQERRKVDIELKKALKKAEDANYVKNAFLANMSHEIRTPLNGIIGFASLLETELSLLENQELFEYANSISESGERLLHLLNNIIDISRIEANDMTISLTSCDVNQIVSSASELFKFKANEKGLRFNVKLEDDLPSIMVDEKSLSKIASDIIDNAVKYTEKGFINVISGFEESRNEVFFKVKDTGVGIDEAYLPNVFEAFRQESLGYSRAYQGAGLGLPLAKRFVELMNGRIEIESKKASGTLISIYFPIKGSNKLPKPASTDTSIETPSEQEEVIVVSTDKLQGDIDPYIFVVEDDRMNRLVIKKMLEKDWRFEMAEDGDITMRMIEEYYKKGIIFEIMLFDINLPPPWDGIKLMHEIKKKYKEYNKIPFIAQTAYAMSGDRERLLEAGFDDYIPKPINRNILVNSIKNQLKS